MTIRGDLGQTSLGGLRSCQQCSLGRPGKFHLRDKDEVPYSLKIRTNFLETGEHQTRPVSIVKPDWFLASIASTFQSLTFMDMSRTRCKLLCASCMMVHQPFGHILGLDKMMSLVQSRFKIRVNSSALAGCEVRFSLLNVCIYKLDSDRSKFCAEKDQPSPFFLSDLQECESQYFSIWKHLHKNLIVDMVSAFGAPGSWVQYTSISTLSSLI